MSIALAWIMRGGWKYLAGALVIIGLLLALRSWGNGREADGVAKERATWQPVVAAIKVQNAKIEELRQASANAAVAIETATEQAQEAREAKAALSARLKAAARARPAVPCKVAPVNAEAWGAIQ